MWANMVLFDEHTWTSWNSVSDPDSDEAIEQLRVKDSRATTASDQRNDILRSGMAALADSVAAGVDSLIVFNPLNWKRDGEVTIDLDKNMEIADRATEEPVSYVVVHEGPNFRRVEFRAEDVPPVGYKVYELRAAHTAPPASQRTTSTTIESRFYRVELDPASGSIRGIYDKVHLVPFGEYLPFQRLLERIGLMQLTKVVGGFLSGDRRRAMDVGAAPKMLPLICYEAIFPTEFDVAAVSPRPEWLLNVTNDAWFGVTPGPYQHFAQARLRAIELGLPLVRAANSGISAVTDGLGRVIAELPLGVDGVIDTGLPVAQADTPFSRYGAIIPAGLWLAALALALALRRRV